MGTATYIGMGSVLLIGSLLQRVTGMGLALVASPFLVLIVGATAGVQTLQVVGLGVCLASAIVLRRDINYRKAGILLIASVVGVVAGTWVAKSLPSDWLYIAVGCITIVALVATMVAGKAKVSDGVRGTGAAGALSGFMNVTAGVGGPPIVIYANSVGWKYLEYVATVQAFFAGLNVLSLAGRGLPSVSSTGWIVIVTSSIVGLLLGNCVGASINGHVANHVILVVALIGSLATIARGVLAI
jgi:uncharacterized membrane protein YfcA